MNRTTGSLFPAANVLPREPFYGPWDDASGSLARSLGGLSVSETESDRLASLVLPLTDFERAFRYEWTRPVREWSLFVYFLVAPMYVGIVFWSSQRAKQKAPSIKRHSSPLVEPAFLLWNLFLAIGSLLAAFRTVPFLFYLLWTGGFSGYATDDPVTGGTSAVWEEGTKGGKVRNPPHSKPYAYTYGPGQSVVHLSRPAHFLVQLIKSDVVFRRPDVLFVALDLTCWMRLVGYILWSSCPVRMGVECVFRTFRCPSSAPSSVPGLVYVLCAASTRTYKRGVQGFYAFLFLHSKWVELGDTLFLILRGRPVSLLHWYHHVSVLMFVWLMVAYEMPSGLIFIAMNYAVHGIMYSYYFAMALLVRFPDVRKRLASVSYWITYMQIGQMVVGVGAVVYHAVLLSRGSAVNCDGSWNCVGAGFLVYLSYLVLFVDYFRGRWRETKLPSKEVAKKGGAKIGRDADCRVLGDVGRDGADCRADGTAERTRKILNPTCRPPRSGITSR